MGSKAGLHGRSTDSSTQG
uniref:Uncharacterized protein n=1 Tax=Anguilla anguilla TaxID=7936 RepID=A0A0E9RYK1_ANGAN